MTGIYKTASDEWAYFLELPDSLKNLDTFGNWEQKTFETMKLNIKDGECVVDIGTELGWQTALLAKYVTNSRNIVMIEPSPIFWSLIKQIWKMNQFNEPKATYQAFLGSKTSTDSLRQIWKTTKAEDIQDTKAYRYLSNETDVANIPSYTLDFLCEKTNLEPHHLVIDVEGSELEILKGAEKTLTGIAPYVFCSVHPDLLEKHHNQTEEELMNYMESLGYKQRLIDVDHEKHYVFWSNKREEPNWLE